MPRACRVEAAGQAVKTQAVPFVADKVGDAVKAAGRAVKDKARPALPATVAVQDDGTEVAATDLGR